MALKHFLRPMNEEDRDAFATACGTTLKYLKLVAYKAKKPNAELCIAIERESGGVVPVESLRPDIDWAFRRQAAGVSAACASHHPA